MHFCGHCPRGHECRKGNSHLGWHNSEQRARQSIFTHLKESCYHDLADQQCRQLADDAELTTWSPNATTEASTKKPRTQPEEDEYWGDWGAEGKGSANTSVSSKASGGGGPSKTDKGAAKQEGGGGKTEVPRKTEKAPYDAFKLRSAKAHPRRETGGSSASGLQRRTALAIEDAPVEASDREMPDQVNGLITRIVETVSRSSVGAHTAADLARDAADAFEEEAGRLDQLLETLQSLYSTVRRR